MTINRPATTLAGTVAVAAALVLGASVPAQATTGGDHAAPSAAVRHDGAATTTGDWNDLPTGKVLATQYASDVKTWLVRSDDDGLVHVNQLERTSGLGGSFLLDIPGAPEPGEDGVRAVVTFGVGSKLDASLLAGVAGDDVSAITVHADRGDVDADVVEGHWLATWQGSDLGDGYDGPVPATVTLRDGTSYDTTV